MGVGGSGFGLPGGDGVVDGGRIGGEVVDEEGEEGGFGVVVVVAGEGGVAAYDEFSRLPGGSFVAGQVRARQVSCSTTSSGLVGPLTSVECRRVSQRLIH